jgi:ADP-ribose pyrophosphatase YjhB (NUDIX family)
MFIMSLASFLLVPSLLLRSGSNVNRLALRSVSAASTSSSSSNPSSLSMSSSAYPYSNVDLSGRGGASSSRFFSSSRAAAAGVASATSPLSAAAAVVSPDATTVAPVDSSLLELTQLRHNSACIKVPAHYTEPSSSSASDAASLSQWRAMLTNSVASCISSSSNALWLEIPIESSHLIPIAATEFGFKFHHSDNGKSSLYIWLAKDTVDKVPAFATHQIGVGAFCMNDKNELLCVRELHGSFSKWKLPGGLVDLGEDLDTAVQREVFEETGLKTKFNSILSARHSHTGQFGRDDLFFICRVQLDEADVGKNPIAEASEIAESAWVPFKEYERMVRDKEGGTRHPMMELICDLAKQGEEADIQKTLVGSIVPGRKPSPIYHIPRK